MSKEITEDCVSLEVAKLLREKGFDCECAYVYGHPNGDYEYVFENFYRPIKNSELIESAYTAPTLQMAEKWLRDVHNLVIMISPITSDEDGDGGCLWNWDVYETGARIVWAALDKNERAYKRYADACNEALEQCLKELVY